MKPFNTKDGVEERIRKLNEIIKANYNDTTTIRADIRLAYWEFQLQQYLVKEADAFIDKELGDD